MLILAAALAAAAPAVQAAAPAKAPAASDEAMRRDFRIGLDRKVGEAGPLIRELFPQEYRTFETDVLARHKANKLAPGEGELLARKFVADLLASHTGDLRHTPGAKAAAVFTAQLMVLKAVQASDPVSCRQFGEVGHFDVGRDVDPKVVKLAANVTVEILRAIRAGQSSPVDHTPFSEADGAWLAQQFLETGGAEDWLAALSSGNLSGFTDRQRCDNIVLFNAAIVAAPEDLQARFMNATAAGQQH